MYLKLIMMCLSAWFFTTLLVDIFVIPSAFRIIGDVFKAGTLGITVFGALNKFEVLWGTLLVFSMLKENALKWKKVQQFLAQAIFAIAAFYYWYLTPKITELTQQLIATQNDATNELIKLDHNFYHHLYVKLDMAKLVILLVLIILQILPHIKSKKMEHP